LFCFWFLPTAERTEARSAQVGTGSRTERIRTYNDLQDRVTDHRAGVTVHGVVAFLASGEGLDEIVDGLEKMERAELLQQIIDLEEEEEEEKKAGKRK
jgi:peptide chain release factor 1